MGEQDGRSFTARQNLANHEYKVPKRKRATSARTAASYGAKSSIGESQSMPGPIFARGPEPYGDRKSLGAPFEHDAVKTEKESRALVAVQVIRETHMREAHPRVFIARTEK